MRFHGSFAFDAGRVFGEWKWLKTWLRVGNSQV